MNLDTNMVLVGDKGQPIQFSTNFASGSIYIEVSMTIMIALTKYNMVGRL